jgi:toxin ParE1/3/4
VNAVRWLRRAPRDLENAHACVAGDNPAAARRLIDQIEEGAELLSGHPGLGRTGRVRGTRELVIAGTPFIVVYRTDGNQAVVLAVLHGARRWPRGF